MLDFSEHGNTRHPTLILLHGLFGSRDNLGIIARSLSEHFHVYSVDLPNHGRSGHIDNCDLERMALELDAWTKELDIKKASVFGHSLGGKVAMEFALTRPDKVHKLIVADIAPVTYENRHDAVFKGLYAINLESISSRRDADLQLQPYVEDANTRSFLLKNLYKTDDKKYAWRMHLQDLHASYSRLRQHNIIATADIDVLFLKAENSDYIQASHKDDILTRFPNASVKTISNTAHWLHAEKPEVIYKVSLNFLSKQSQK